MFHVEHISICSQMGRHPVSYLIETNFSTNSE